MDFTTNYNLAIKSNPNSNLNFWGLGQAAKINGVEQAVATGEYKAVSAGFGDASTSHPTRADWYNADALLGQPSSKGMVCPQALDLLG